VVTNPKALRFFVCRIAREPNVYDNLSAIYVEMISPELYGRVPGKNTEWQKNNTEYPPRTSMGLKHRNIRKPLSVFHTLISENMFYSIFSSIDGTIGFEIWTLSNLYQS